MSFALRGCALARGVRSTPFCVLTALVELSTLALPQIAGESCAVRSSQSSLGKRSRLVGWQGGCWHASSDQMWHERSRCWSAMRRPFQQMWSGFVLGFVHVATLCRQLKDRTPSQQLKCLGSDAPTDVRATHVKFFCSVQALWRLTVCGQERKIIWRNVIRSLKNSFWANRSPCRSKPSHMFNEFNATHTGPCFICHLPYEVVHWPAAFEARLFVFSRHWLSCPR